jgi:DUF4097 and DUF4098 domain-containing protein YvlB
MLRHHGRMLERVRITVRSGRLRVSGETRDDLDVEGARVSGEGPEVEFKVGSKPVTARVPATTEIIVGSHSGDVSFTGAVGAVRVTTASADVDAEDVASIDARSTSGRLRVGRSRGSLRLKTTSANVRVDRVDGEVKVASISATVEIRAAHGPVAIKTVSGDIDVTVDGTAAVLLESVSGSITVRVPDGRRPDVRVKTISGKKRVEVESGNDFQLGLRSVSGTLTVTGS